MADEEAQDQQTNDGTEPVEDQDNTVEPFEDEDEVDEASDEEPSLADKLKEVIDVRVEDVGVLRKKLTITVPHDALAEQLDEQYSEMRTEAAVPGFRKGRAPRRLLEKRFGREVNEQLISQIVSSGYMAATDKNDLKVLGDPQIWAREKDAETDTLMEVTRAVELMKLPDGDEPFVFACEVEIQPEFELPELEGIELKKPAITITDDDVTEYIDRLRKFRGHFEPLPDGTVELDDLVIADLKMTSGDTVLKEEENVRVAARPQQVDGVSLEKLGEVLIGAKAGDVRTTSGEIPDNYVKLEFRGKQADFEFKVREIQRLNVPALDEELIQDFGYDSEDELRESAKNDLESRIAEQIQRGLIGQVYQYLLDKTDFELPERLSKRQESTALTRRLLDMYRQGVPPAETEKLMDQLRMGAKEETARELKRFFIMEKLSEEFDVKVDEAEINNLIASIAYRQGRRFDRVRDELAKEGGIMHLYLQIRDEKIIQQLIEKARITESKPETEEKKTKGKKKTTKSEKEGQGTAEDADNLADET